MGTTADYLSELSDWTADGFDQHWELVGRFVADIGAQAALAAARSWCDSSDAGIHSAGLDVLGALARRDAGLVGELLDLVNLAQHSDNEDVRWSAAVALQQIDDIRARDALVPFLSDSDPDVRCQAVYGLSPRAVPDLTEEHPVIQALLRAMEDPHERVRDWATFTIGALYTVDTPAVRDALARHLDDDGADTAGEAAVGLAIRGDPRVYPVLVERLADPDVGNLYLEAACELADPRVLPLLLELRSGGWQEDEPRPSILDEAIAACSPSAETDPLRPVE
jgi:HEAT repeat protein